MFDLGAPLIKNEINYVRIYKSHIYVTCGDFRLPHLPLTVTPRYRRRILARSNAPRSFLFPIHFLKDYDIAFKEVSHCLNGERTTTNRIEFLVLFSLSSTRWVIFETL